MIEISPKDVRRAAMDMLARREHSRLELKQKLSRKFSDQAQTIEEEILKLTREGLQSDARLAEAFIRARTNKGQGPMKIRVELRNKGISDDDMALAFEECSTDWFSLAQEVAEKKFGPGFERQQDMKEKSRVARFLGQRGFSYDHISSLY